MRLGELIPISKIFKSKSIVPAGKAACADLGTVELSIGIAQPSGDTSRSAIPMPKYKIIPGHKQGTK